MAAPEGQSEVWVAATVKELREAGSWTGRIHVHKLLFTLQVLELAEPPFEFELKHYGPYSPEVDSEFVFMEAYGQLEKQYPMPGYGPRYDVAVDSTPGLEPTEQTAVRNVAQVFGLRNSRELELIATCLWVQKREGLDDDASIVSRVRELKPKYDTPTIEQHLKKARELEAQLTQ